MELETLFIIFAAIATIVYVGVMLQLSKTPKTEQPPQPQPATQTPPPPQVQPEEIEKLREEMKTLKIAVKLSPLEDKH